MGNSIVNCSVAIIYFWVDGKRCNVSIFLYLTVLTVKSHLCFARRAVKIIRLLGRDTVEEIIYSRAVSKLRLTNTVIEEGRFSLLDQAQSAASGLQVRRGPRVWLLFYDYLCSLSLSYLTSCAVTTSCILVNISVDLIVVSLLRVKRLLRKTLSFFLCIIFSLNSHHCSWVRSWSLEWISCSHQRKAPFRKWILGRSWDCPVTGSG